MGFVLPVFEYCSAVWCSAADTHLKLLDNVVSGACFLTGGVHIVDLWQYFVCYTRSDVIRCNLFVVLYLGRMCQCGLHAVLWSHTGILMHLLGAEPHSTAEFLFPSHYLSGTILMTLYSMVWDWRVSEAGQCHFISLGCSFTFVSFTVFPFSSFLLWVGIVRLGSSD